MDEATFRILDSLSREIGSTISIHQLTSKIRQYYGTGYYARTYNRVIELSKQELITITKAGRSSIPSLNFSSYSLLDLLSEIEMRKKRELLDRSRNLQPLIMDIEAYAHNDSQIESISLMNPERNAKLNRAELLVLTRNSSENGSKQMTSIYRMMRDAQSKHNIRTDTLLLSTEDFAELLASDEINPLKEMLSNKIAFFAPQAFWAEIADALAKGRWIRLLGGETNPAKIAEKDMDFNLNRFGYMEMGSKIAGGEKICIEYIISSILMKGEARRINAIPILLSKNTANYNLLIFLSQKYGLSGRLLGLLRAMHKIKPQGKIAIMMEIMKELGAKEIKADENAIAQNMRLYNAVR
jgi:hypothetical protein